MRRAATQSRFGFALTSVAVLGLALAMVLVLARAESADAFPLGPAQIELKSGVDTVSFAISGGASGTAQVYSINTFSGSRCDAAWADPIAETSWIGVSADCTNAAALGSAGEPRVTNYSVGFELPSGFLDPSISVSVHADNAATIFLNDTQIGAQPGCSPDCPTANFQGDPEAFVSSDESLFEVGSNTLRFSVADFGVVTGLDFSAVVTFTQGPAELDHFDFEPIGDQTAGVPFNVVVTAIDVNGNVKTDYNSNITPTHNLGNAPRGDAPFVSIFDFTEGEATGIITAFKAETGRTITLTDGLVSDTSNAFDVGHAAPQNIVFGQQPTTTLVDTVITPAPTVIVRDAFHNVATQATNDVTMAIGNNPGNGLLLGTTSRTPVDGVATFSGLSITESGGGYTLVASTAVPAGTATVTSDPFIVANTIVDCGSGCSASASNATTTVNVTVPGSGGGGAARALGGVVDDDLAIALDAAGGSFTCGGVTRTAIGSISTVDPPAGHSSANPITVEVTYLPTIIPTRDGVAHYVLCKDSGFGTPFFVVPKCAKKNPVAPCEIRRSAVGTAGVRFLLLITSVDPRLTGR
jgi:hypothetical protein